MKGNARHISIIVAHLTLASQRWLGVYGMNATPSLLLEPGGYPENNSLCSPLGHCTEDEPGQIPLQQPVLPHRQQQKPLVTNTRRKAVAQAAILSTRR